MRGSSLLGRAHAGAAALLLALAAPALAAPPALETIGADLEPLRTRFNAAAGQVRAVLLVAPT